MVTRADTGVSPVLRGGNTYPQAKGLWALGGPKEKPDDVGPVNAGRPGSKPTRGGVYVCQHLSFTQVWEGDQGYGQGQNRTREIRLSGIVGGLTETWVMVKAKRARPVETPKQPSFNLRLRAPYFYPD